MDSNASLSRRLLTFALNFLASGAALVMLGLTMIVAWHGRLDLLLQFDRDYPPMQYNTAVCFVLIGCTFAMCAVGYSVLPRVLVATVAGVSSLSLVQDIFGVDLGIDQLLFTPYIATATAVPGRMAPHTAVAFVLTCIAIGMATHQRPLRQRPMILAVTGSLVASIGVVAFVGYLTGFEQAYGWGRFTKMAAQTAAGFVAVGLGILVLSWREARATSTHTPRWLFAPITVGVAAVSIIFCQALINYEDQQIDLSVRTESAAVQQEVESELAGSVAVIERIAARWDNGDPQDQERWESNIGLHFEGPNLFKAIEWVNRDYQPTWVVPMVTNASDIGVNLRETPELLDALAIARSEHRTVMSQPFDRGRGYLEIAVAHPVYSNQLFAGFILGIFHVQELFGLVLNADVAPGTSVAVYDGEHRIFTRGLNRSHESERWAVETPAAILNLEMTLRVWPGTVSPQRSLLPYAALTVGFLVAGLLGLVTWLLQHAAERSRAVQQANVSLQSEVVQRRRTEAQLLQSTGALERSNRSLQEFAYVASHDLKAPLVSIEGLATMLSDDAGDKLEGDGRLYLDRIVFNATRMRSLLDDLLELSRVGREDTKVSAVALGPIIDGVTNQLHQVFSERGVTVVVSQPLPTVAANPVRLHQVFNNLIDNAVKYTPLDRQPRIEIGAVDAGDTWRVTVRDNGVGIPTEHRDKIFTMFQRLPKGRALNPSGTGMGLAIVFRIVESNGGRCWIDNSDASGTTFCLTFPKPEPHHLTRGARSALPADVA